MLIYVGGMYVLANYLQVWHLIRITQVSISASRKVESPSNYAWSKSWTKIEDLGKFETLGALGSMNAPLVFNSALERKLGLENKQMNSRMKGER